MKLSHAVVLLLSATLFASRAFADGGVVAELVAHKVVSIDGHEKLVSADAAKPGDTLQYSVTYKNQTGAVAKGVVATLPVPNGDGVEYIADSGKPRITQASLDGRTYAPVPLTRVVTLPNGKRETQPVPASEYKSLRWALGDLPAGGAVTVSARMRVSNSPTTASTQAP